VREYVEGVAEARGVVLPPPDGEAEGAGRCAAGAAAGGEGGEEEEEEAPRRRRKSLLERARRAGRKPRRVKGGAKEAEETAAVAAGGGACERDTVTVGFVGHPNVGKTSLLNALVGRKVASVWRTPGHTKPSRRES